MQMASDTSTPLATLMSKDFLLEPGVKLDTPVDEKKVGMGPVGIAEQMMGATSLQTEVKKTGIPAKSGQSLSGLAAANVPGSINSGGGDNSDGSNGSRSRNGGTMEADPWVEEALREMND